MNQEIIKIMFLFFFAGWSHVYIYMWTAQCLHRDIILISIYFIAFFYQEETEQQNRNQLCSIMYFYIEEVISIAVYLNSHVSFFFLVFSFAFPPVHMCLKKKSDNRGLS
jgi:hypothetical protein